MRFNPGWKLSIMVAVLLPLLLSLGHWQLQRADEKREILQIIDKRRSAEPTMLEGVEHGNELAYRQVVVRGHYLAKQVILLDNRIVQGRFGYEWLQLFSATSGEIYAISRGWVPGSLHRSELPSLPYIGDEVEITAEVYVPLGNTLQLAEEAIPDGWPKRLQSLDVAVLAEELNVSIFPYVLRLREGSIGFLQACWQDINVQPAKHTAYAVQWYAMAAVLVLMYFGVGFTPLARADKSEK